MWNVDHEGGANPTDFQNKTDAAYTGDIFKRFEG